MRKYLLDSDTLTYLEQQDSPFHEKVRQRLSQRRDDDEVMVSVLSLYEMHYGISWASDEERRKLSQAVDSIANKFTVVGLSRRGASLFGDLKAEYRRTMGIAPNALKRNDIDLLIASVALAQGAILVSNDRLFESVIHLNSDFRLENWAV
jgi:predicted nucleic acid-binding protein